MSYVSQLQVPKSHSVCSSSSSSPLSACPSLPPSSVPFSFLKPFHRSLRPRSLGSQSTACLDQHAALPLSLSPQSFLSHQHGSSPRVGISVQVWGPSPDLRWARRSGSPLQTVEGVAFTGVQKRLFIVYCLQNSDIFFCRTGRCQLGRLLKVMDHQQLVLMLLCKGFHYVYVCMF